MANTAYPRTFLETEFGEGNLQPDGRYKVTIPATEHNLGTTYHVAKLLKMDANHDNDNVIPVYRVLSNGDFELFVEEPGTYKTYLVKE